LAKPTLSKFGKRELNKITSNKLANQLSHLSAEQLENIIKQATYLRKKAGKSSGTLDEWILRAYQREERILKRATEVQDATVLSVWTREALIETVDENIKARIGNHQVVVGDKVSVGLLEGEPAILAVQSRRTKLSRPDVHSTNKEQLIVANVDSVVIVVSVVSPPLHPRLIDRYLVAIQNGGAIPVICVNKIDLLEDSDDLEKLKPYQEIGLPVFLCSVIENQGIAEVREHLKGQTVAFVGHSGVGKSSLANAFAPELGLKIGDVSEGYGRGTHTTTTSSLHRLANGTTLIDTPGIRSFGIWDSSQEDLVASFPEFAAFECKFNDCKHVSEPGCGVLEALESGAVSEERYGAYRRMSEETSG
jgi:ribosome biogenesis GTPase